MISHINPQSRPAMDVWQYSTAYGARISQYPYNATTPNQRFVRRRV